MHKRNTNNDHGLGVFGVPVPGSLWELIDCDVIIGAGAETIGRGTESGGGTATIGDGLERIGGGGRGAESGGSEFTVGGGGRVVGGGTERTGGGGISSSVATSKWYCQHGGYWEREGAGKREKKSVTQKSKMEKVERKCNTIAFGRRHGYRRWCAKCGRWSERTNWG